MLLRRVLGLGVVDVNEKPLTRACARYFDMVMLVVIFWLPVQWYAETNGLLAPEFRHVADWVVWGLFLIEALVMTAVVKEKWRYTLGNWLNIFIIIAVFPLFWADGSTYLALLRYLRLMILIRLMLPQLYYLHRILSRNNFGMTLLVFLIVTVLGGILITFIDPALGSPWRGIWWALQTVTTLGYGDIIPDTVIGKVFASILMLGGVGLLSLVSANFAAYFIERGRRQQEKKPEKKLQRQFNELSDRLNKIESLNRQIVDSLIPKPENDPAEDKSKPASE